MDLSLDRVHVVVVVDDDDDDDDDDDEHFESTKHMT